MVVSFDFSVLCFMAALRQFGTWPAQTVHCWKAGSNGLISPVRQEGAK